MKSSSNVIDEMFPDGSGNMMMELDEVMKILIFLFCLDESNDFILIKSFVIFYLTANCIGWFQH